MRNIVAGMALLLITPALADPPTAETSEGPVIRGGLWEVTREGAEYGPAYEGGPVVERRRQYVVLECVGPGPLVSGKRAWLVTSDRRAYAEVGFSDGSPIAVTTIISGEFNESFVRLDTSYSYSVGEVRFGYRESLLHSRERYVRRGDCPSGMKPGDRKDWAPPPK